MKQSIILLCCLLAGLSGQADQIFTTINNDTVTIWHTGTNRNCCSLFDMQVAINGNMITVTESDTASELCYCTCDFDLSVSLTGLENGFYVVEIYGNDVGYQAYWGSTSFTIGDGFTVYDPVNSGCLTTRNDTAFIELSVTGDTLDLFWDTPMLNCCLEPVWYGWLEADTFHVTMTDTGAPCDCICPFELQAGFGPFPAGTYTLDFWYGNYGYPEFTIGGGSREALDFTIVDQNQSDCYHYIIAEDQQPPDNFRLYPAYPNPFNPQTKILYYLPEAVDVELTVFDLKGQLVATLAVGRQEEGLHSAIWDGRNEKGYQVGTGVYLYRLQTGQHHQTGKLVLLK